MSYGVAWLYLPGTGNISSQLQYISRQLPFIQAADLYRYRCGKEKKRHMIEQKKKRKKQVRPKQTAESPSSIPLFRVACTPV